LSCTKDTTDPRLKLIFISIKGILRSLQILLPPQKNENHAMFKYISLVLTGVSLLFFIPTKAQDTLKLSLEESETLFLQNNLHLIAGRIDLDIKDLQIEVEKLWDNPAFELEHQILNRAGKGPLGFTNQDNTAFGFEQLFVTAGKRGHRIQLAELDRMMTEHELGQLIREFKRTLREEFINLAFLNRMEGLYQQQIDALDQILVSFEEQLEEGNIPRIEVIRLRALVIELEKEYNELIGKQQQARKALSVLLQLENQLPEPIFPQQLENILQREELPNLDELYELALESRKDLRSAMTGIDYAERSLMLERANQWPDVGIGLVYDRLDGFVDNYFAITFSTDLPLWNRNRQNIQIATHQIRQSELQFNQKQQELLLEIQTAINRYERAIRLFERADHTFEQEFGSILEAINLQYRQGDIRLIEFIDFYESFREGIIRNYKISEELLQSAEELNFIIGQDIIQFNF